MSRDILISLIDRDPKQPRQTFDPVALDELAQSMAANGLAVPILLRPAGDRFIIVHGERRYRAACSLGWATIPADVRDVPPDEARWLSLLENIQRSDLSPIEEARAYQSHLADGLTQTQLAQRIGKGQSYIAQKLRLLTLPDPLQLLLDRKAITEGHARQLLKLKGMYTEEFTCDFPPEAWLFEDKEGEQYDLSHRVWMAVVNARLEDNPPVPWQGLMPRDATQAVLVRDACHALNAYLARHGGIVPLWEYAAFWWAVASVTAGLSVAMLDKGLDTWYERFASAVLWWDYHGKGQEPPTGKSTRDRLNIMEYWCYQADLRHGLVLDHLEEKGIPDDLFLNVVKKVFAQDYYILPSAMQEWGNAYQNYIELKTKMDEESSSRWYVT